MSGPGGGSTCVNEAENRFDSNGDGASAEEEEEEKQEVTPPLFRCSCRASSSSSSSGTTAESNSDNIAGHGASDRPILTGRDKDHNHERRAGDDTGVGAPPLRRGNARDDRTRSETGTGTGAVTRLPNSPASAGTVPPPPPPLERSSKLCDRERESEQLRLVFDRCCLSPLDDEGSTDDAAAQSVLPCSPPAPNRGELALVTGPSGTGKTCLVESAFGEALRRSRRRRRRCRHRHHQNREGRCCRDEADGGVGTGDGDACEPKRLRQGADEAEGIDDARGVVICGKFDQLERREQYYAIVQALTEYALIVARESAPVQLRSVRRALAPHRETVRIVAELVPELQTLLDLDENDSTGIVPPDERPRGDAKPAEGATYQARSATNSAPEGGTLARERLQLGLRRFFSSVCSPESPIVLFLDDLQWAEPASLDLLASLFTHRIPGLVMVGACRDNEVDPASYLCVVLRELEATGVTITQVIVSNVGPAALVSALGDSFGAGSDKANALARILYEHTAGNMFFVTQLVHYLVSEGILYQQKESLTWTFDSDLRVLDAIRAAKDVVSLLAIVIQKQQREVQDTLMVASCLGAEFSELALKTAVAFDVEESLQVAQHWALLKRSSHVRQTWRFVHDRIQESAYSLIPLHEREQIHLAVGRKLWSAMSEGDLDVHAHVVVKQLRLGVRLMTDPGERELLSALLLRAGEMAAKASAHVTAQEYVSLGIELLDTRHWRDQYSLSLALFNAAAEIEYCLANFERMDALVKVIMENARGTKDTIRAQTARIYSLGSRNHLEEAIDVGLDTLRNFLGETIPSRPSAASIVVELWKTRRLLRQHSDASFMSLPAMDDFKTLSSMRIMCLLLMYGLLGRPNLTPILAMRIVQHSLRHGLCGMSGTGFAFYGMVLAQFFNDVDSGIRYSTVALGIVERFDAMEQLARVSTVAHCFCLAYTEPLPSLLQPLRLAHRVGMGSGDIEQSLVAAGLYSMVAVQISIPLSSLATELSSFLSLTATYRHSSTDLLFRPLAQVVHCLRGEEADPSKLSGTYLNWEESLSIAEESNHGPATAMILTSKLMVEVIFRKVDDAEYTARRLARRGSGMETAPIFMKAAVWLYRGLTYAALAHRDGFFSRRTIRQARKCHRRLVGLRRYSERNYGGKALLLGAEIMMASGGSQHQALLEYDAAVTASRSSEVWSDAALACERLSVALMAKGRSEESLLYSNQSAKYYERWGATAKVVELRSAIAQKQGIARSASGPKR